MSDFEQDLRSALRREEPSPGFAARVVAGTGARAAPRRAGWLTAAIAACLLLSVGGFEYRQYRGQKAKQQLLLALEIAGDLQPIGRKRAGARVRCGGRLAGRSDREPFGLQAFDRLPAHALDALAEFGGVLERAVRCRARREWLWLLPDRCP